MKKRLLWLVAIPLIAIGSLTYANDFIVPDTENGTITVYSQDKSYWITIQDKNLWAENVWDYGYYYQWWNNHGNPAWTNAWTLNELLDANVNERVNKWYSGENDKFIIFNNWNKTLMITEAEFIIQTQQIIHMYEIVHIIIYGEVEMIIKQEMQQ